MVKKDYSWVEQHIIWAINNSYPVTANAFKTLLEDIEKLQEENRKLTRQVGYYKYDKKKAP